MTIEILRSAQAQKLTGRPRSSFYQQISQGLLPPPIKLGARAVGWLASEIEAVNKARIQGKSDDEIKILVASLIKQRSQL
ncbi:MAG TPA: AlpA family phage regulatory protein [Candidatus Aphodousia faecipullorum]|nr:AlpA family phage regulatory protein [Candidatus Aphodousia faecipullorum]